MCYSDSIGHQLPIGMSVSDSPADLFLKELAIGCARLVATLWLTSTLTISNSSESDSNNDAIIVSSINPE